MSMVAVFQHPIVRAAVAGFVAAAVVDIRVWKSWGDVAFNFKTASYRWLAGAVSGALVGAGFGAL